MKKFLLSLALVATTAFGAMAEVAGFGVGEAGKSSSTVFTSITNNSSGNIVNEPFTAGDISIQLTKVNTSSSLVNGTQVRWYAKDVITVTPANGAKITEITVNTTSATYGKVTVTVSSEELATNGTMSSDIVKTWSSAEGIGSPIELTAGAQVRFTYMLVTYTAGGGQETTVATPVISLNEEANGYFVDITCETEGAEIYYTTDGTAPAADNLAAATKYTAPFQLWESATVKAMAVVGDQVSKVATFNAEIPMQLEDFSALYGIEPSEIPSAGILAEFKAPMTVVYQSGAYLYLACGNYFALFYGSHDAVAVGSTLTSAKGTIINFNGLVEVTNYTLGDLTPGELTIQPVATPTVDAIAANMQSHYLKLTNMNISSVSGKNATITDALGNTLALYNQLGATIENIDNVDITGFVGVYDTTVQFYPTEITDAAGVAIVAAPVFNPASGSSIERNTYILITTATEGATIMYSLDGTNFDPYAEDEVLATTIGEFSVWAYAELDGEKSETVKATYTVTKPSPNLRWLNNDYEEVAEVIYMIDGTDEQKLLPMLDGIIEDEPTFSSSNTAVATVTDGGEVEVLGVGETTITVAVPETSSYAAGSASYLLKVVSAQQATAIETTVIFANTKSFSASAKTQTWTSEDGYEFVATASINGNTYPAVSSTHNLRMYGSSSNEIAVTGPENYEFTSVTITINPSQAQSAISINGTTAYDPSASSVAPKATTATGDNYTVELESPATEVTLKATGAKNTELISATFTIRPINTAVAEIEAAEAETEAVYYNLQGVRVASPAAGLYIRVSGGKAQKVIIR